MTRHYLAPENSKPDILMTRHYLAPENSKLGVLMTRHHLAPENFKPDVLVTRFYLTFSLSPMTKEASWPALSRHAIASSSMVNVPLDSILPAKRTFGRRT